VTTQLHSLARLLILWCFLAAGGLAAADERAAVFDLEGDGLSVRAAGGTMRISLRSPSFALGDASPIGNAAPSAVQRSASGEPSWEVSYPPLPAGASATLEIQTTLRWSRDESLLRKRAKFRLVGASESRVLKEVVLDRIASPERSAWTHAAGGPGLDSRVPLEGPQSHPAFLAGRFVGVEYPVASTRRETGAIVLAHRPGVRMRPGAWYETRTAVYGLAARGDEVGAFQRYIAAHRPASKGFHINYNSWWTSPVPYTENDILALMKVFDERFTRAHGVPLDTFTIDLGWSDPKSLWEIDAKLFPDGFARIRDAAWGFGSRPAVAIRRRWMGPGRKAGDTKRFRRVRQAAPRTFGCCASAENATASNSKSAWPIWWGDGASIT
jgi:hypothetical protein